MADTHSLKLDNTPFPAPGQFANASDSASLSVTGDITIECWVNCASIPQFNSTGQAFIAKTDFAGNNSYLFSYLGGAGGKRLHLEIYNDGTNVDSFSVGADLLTGVWHHVAVTWEASTSKTN